MKLDKSCAHCIKSFTWKSERKEFCSDKCRTRHQRIRYPDKYLDKQVKLYGLNLDVYKNMVTEQKNLCFACGQPEEFTKPKSTKIANLCVDHDHKTGQVRKLLCRRCNLLVGQMENDMKRVEDCFKYLQQLKATR